MIVALAGGVGGARLARGLADLLPPEELVVAVNVGDDFTHLGLAICPDIDTVTYTLAGLNDEQRGWGIRDETWSFMAALRQLGGPDWFALGDRDLAKHVLRTERLRRGDSLTAITHDLARASGVMHRVIPVSDDPVRSIVMTDAGDLSFQDYFVRMACAPVFRGIRFEGADVARINPQLRAALADPALAAIVICPSNPVLSVAPILAVPGVAEALRDARVPRIAVSPFIGGEAVKGPAAKIMRELGLEPGAAVVAERYAGLVDAVLCDHRDPAAGQTVAGIALIARDTLMRGAAGQQRLAGECLALAAELRSAG